jgi:hypothetical protein
MRELLDPIALVLVYLSLIGAAIPGKCPETMRLLATTGTVVATADAPKSMTISRDNTCKEWNESELAS